MGIKIRLPFGVRGWGGSISFFEPFGNEHQYYANSEKRHSGILRPGEQPARIEAKDGQTADELAQHRISSDLKIYEKNYLCNAADCVSNLSSRAMRGILCRMAMICF